MTVIRQLDPAVTIFSVPFMRFGLIPVGGRSTAVRLSNGKVVLFASHANDAETDRTLKAMGSTVSHIIALDAVHQLYLSDYIKDYPSAKLVGPEGLVTKRKDLKFDIVLPRDPLDDELETEFKAIPMTGHPNEDIVWYHQQTKNLIQADVLFNLPSKDQSSWSLVPSFLVSRLNPFTAFHRTAVAAFSKKDPRGFAEAAKTIEGLDFQRIIPCHGEIIEGPKAKEAWQALFQKFLS